ncbi:MAG: heavy-metal-associated domain-containing protein [Ignavibacteria bacterium]|jgi:copper chaperone CopZ
MNTLKFKTNIKCKNCVSTVTPYLDEDNKISEWNVDLENPDRVLTVTGNGITNEHIKDTLLKAGYKAEQIS